MKVVHLIKYWASFPDEKKPKNMKGQVIPDECLYRHEPHEVEDDQVEKLISDSKRNGYLVAETDRIQKILDDSEILFQQWDNGELPAQ